MSPLLLAAIVFITLALIFYTTGVFGERRSGTLTVRHVVICWLGLCCDTTGTLLMSRIASQNAGAGNPLHAVTGTLAIVLMLIHAVWAVYTLRRGTEHARRIFHKFSLAVWLVWLIPYVLGMVIGMG